MKKKAATITPPSKHAPIPATGRKRVTEGQGSQRTLTTTGHPPIVAVLFEPDKALGLGQQIGTFDRIDLRDRPITEDRSIASKHRGLFTIEIHGPLLSVEYDGPKGKAHVAIPIVGNVRRITFV